MIEIAVTTSVLVRLYAVASYRVENGSHVLGSLHVPPFMRFKIK